MTLIITIKEIYIISKILPNIDVDDEEHLKDEIAQQLMAEIRGWS